MHKTNHKNLIRNALLALFIVICLFGISLLLMSAVKQNVIIDSKTEEYNNLTMELNSFTEETQEEITEGFEVIADLN